MEIFLPEVHPVTIIEEKEVREQTKHSTVTVVESTFTLSESDIFEKKEKFPFAKQQKDGINIKGKFYERFFVVFGRIRGFEKVKDKTDSPLDFLGKRLKIIKGAVAIV